MRYVAGLLALACAGCYFETVPDFRPQAMQQSVAYGDPMTRAEVEKLLKAGVSDGLIVEKAKKSGVAQLSADDIVALKQAGASDDLIKELIASHRAPAPRTAYAAPSVYYERYDWWWGPPAVYWGFSYAWPHHHYYRCGPRTRGRVGISVGW